MILFLVSILSHLLLCVSDDRLTPGEFISSNESLVSDGSAFALGFFSPTNSSSDLYLGVWYNNMPQKTVVWVANREKPITNSPAVLRISNDSNLIVTDSVGLIFWSSNLSGIGTPGNNTVAVLLNTGNLVLREDSNGILWQSFDHPTDTFLPGMKIQYNYSSHLDKFFRSWKDEKEPAPGNFSFGIDSNNSLQVMTWLGPKIYWRSQVWSGNLFSGALGPNSTSVTYLTIIADEDSILMQMTVSDISAYIRYTLSYSGQLQLLSWDNGSELWQIYASGPVNNCEKYGWCGQFAYCDGTESVPSCKCLKGFQPKLQSEWDAGNYSAGCIRMKVLKCGEGDGFLKMEGMKLPDQFVFLRNRSITDCRSECMANCSCTAYAYSELNMGSNMVPRCLVWMGELIDTGMLSSKGEDLYLRLMDITSGIPGVQCVFFHGNHCSIVAGH